MFRFVGLFFLFIGLIQLFFGIKDTLKIIEFRLVSETTPAEVIDTKKYTRSTRWGERTHQKIIFTYMRNNEKEIDTVRTEYSGNHQYNIRLDHQQVGNKLIVRYSPKNLFFENRFAQNDKKEVTEDGKPIDGYFDEGVRLFIGLGFSFIGFVFYRLFKGVAEAD